MIVAKFDEAMEIVANNESGACNCHLSDKVTLLISDRGETVAVWDFRPNAKRVEKVVTVQWAAKFLGRAIGVRIESFDW